MNVEWRQRFLKLHHNEARVLDDKRTYDREDDCDPNDKVFIYEG